MAASVSVSDSGDDDSAGLSLVGERTSSISAVKDAVDGLYHFRDHYFESHDMAQACRKDSDVAEELKKVIAVIEAQKESCSKLERAQFYYLWGRALNVASSFSEEALNVLKKSVKLDFKLVDSWIELGECFWKKGDMNDAKNCFEGALRQGPSKVALRNMSMVLRQLPCAKDDKKQNVIDSLAKAKEAVNLDVGDGMSWLVLGNACLTAFFSLGQDPKYLKQCMAAYQQATADPVAVNNPDLHYNRAVALKYEEDYQGALDGFSKARLLDCAWSAPRAKEDELVSYLNGVQNLIDKKGRMKLKRLQTFASSLQDVDKHLGPYAGGKYVGSGGRSINLKLVQLSALQPGINPETVVLGKVVCGVPSEDPVPFTFCFVDEQLTCTSATVYNLAEKQGFMTGDAIAIPEPFLQEVKVSHGEMSVSYSSIRVDSPMVLVVNSRKLGLAKHAPSEIGFSSLRDS